MFLTGFLISVLRGTTWPIFSIIYGRVFLTLSNTIVIKQFSNSTINELELKDKIFSEILINSSLLLLIGLIAGITTFASGSLLGIVGEKFTMRLRLAVFKVGVYFLKINYFTCLLKYYNKQNNGLIYDLLFCIF